MAQREGGATTDRVANLLREVGIAPTIERAKEKSDELVRALVEFYGEGIERMLGIVHEAAEERSDAIFAALCNDPFVDSLLALHDLHPLSLEDRVQAALNSILPYLESHEGSVELVRVEDGIAFVRLAGSCDGCQSSAATLKNAVETAILEHVSDVYEVRAEGAQAASAGHSLKLQSDWVALGDIPALATHGITQVVCSGTSVLIVSHDDTVFAYRDRCPSCTRPFDGAKLEWPFVRCAVCHGRFDVVHAGRVEDGANDGRFAEPFPLVRESERLRVAIPLGV